MASATVEKLTQDLKAAHEKLANLDKPARDPNSVLGTPGNPRQAPHGTSGPVLKDSTPFSMTSFLQNLIVKGLHDETKQEREFCDRFARALRTTGNMLNGEDTRGRYWVPSNIEAFGPSIYANDQAAQDVTFCKAMLGAAQARAFDPEEFQWLKDRGYIVVKAGSQSAFFDQQGGTLVAPPTQGQVIPLIRPNAAVLAAGASTMVLPPSGKYVEPRITSAPTVAAYSESNTIADSNLGTGQMTLQSKKIAGLVKMSRESSLYTSGTQDQWVQSELNRSLGLKFDSYAMYGSGGDNIPLGLVNQAGTGDNQVLDVFEQTNPVPSGVGANGNNLQPQYGDQVPAMIEERSFGLDSDEGGSWVMRPGTFSKVRSQRVPATVPGDQAGVFTDQLRRFSESGAAEWMGRKVVRSTNVRKDQSKGSSGSTLTDAFYGLWKYMVVATYGAVSFEQGYINDQFAKDEISVKGVMYGDVGLRYVGAFAWLKLLTAPTKIS